MDKEKKDPIVSKADKSKVSRRNFVKGAATVAAAAATVPLKPLLGGPGSSADASTVPYQSNTRANDSFQYRRRVAQENKIDIGVLPDNGDRARYSDFSALYSKALLHNGLGVPNQASYLSFLNALEDESFEALQNVIVGTPGGGPNSKLNGPATAFAFDLEGLDSHAFTIPPPAPTVRSAQTATEEVEHYWASLLRDLPFTEYGNDPTGTVAAAVADLNSRSFLQGGGAGQWNLPVTPQNLFRGRVFANDGNTKGPYISQFMLQPTFFGAQELTQKFETFSPNQAFLTNPEIFKGVQNGGASGEPIKDGTFRHIRNGRDLAAYTRVDALHQAYFVAFLVLLGIKAPINPGNPYGRPGGPIPVSNTQKPFGTLGPPDAFATIPEVATRALKASWFRKWIVDLRLRPEEYGALVHARKTGTTPVPQASTELHNDVLSSAVLPRIFNQYGSYLVPQAFPEGSPTHPCYTGGHATVAGACATIVKFFVDGSQKIRPLLLAAGSDVKQPTTDGLALVPYNGADKDQLDINGELSKLAFNIPFGHGVHSGIHFRSSNYWGILLGEAVALSFLKDRAKSYNEPFTINITKFDGTTATITNQNEDLVFFSDGPCPVTEIK
ncbi:MAG TPA: twin-arginine translocation signal domain-containing protein [Pyrinomonadaceae bacterium]|nr:twin-arginine translocation signal domain-containing protein [Pyrinomonadaceae bacterium]